MSRTARWLVTLSALCLVMGGRAAAQVDAAADFSLASNPNGLWSYGYSSTLTGAITLFNTPATNSGFEFWKTAAAEPWIVKNTNGGALAIPGYPSTTLGQNALAMMPAANTFTHLIFTAPQTGQFSYNAIFTAVDNTTTTNVWALVNGATAGTGSVLGPGILPGFGTVEFGPTFASLSAGQTLDFVVGPGADGFDSHDATGISARVLGPGAVPLPPVAWITMFGGACTLFTVRRRAKS